MMTKKHQRLAAIILLSGLYFFSWGCMGSHSRKPMDAHYREIDNIMSEISADSIKSNVETLAEFHTRHTVSDTVSDFRGIGAARRWIYKKFHQYRRASDDRLKVYYDRYTEKDSKYLKEPTEIVNVAGLLPGTQLESKERMYIVAGHYDSSVPDVMDDSSYAPGANDNASGTAGVMELARVLSNYRFDATIVFLAVAGEAQGLLGSNHYAKKAAEKNLNIAGMLSNDTIGRSEKKSEGSGQADEVRVFVQGMPTVDSLSRDQRRMLATGGENDTPSRQLGRFIQTVAHKHLSEFDVNIIYREDRYLKVGDQSSFLDEGYPAVRISQPNEFPTSHSQNVNELKAQSGDDLPEFLDYEYLTQVTRLNAATVITLANAPARPGGVSMDISRLDPNNTTLLWEANDEPDLKGYEIVWRATNQPFWEQAKFVGDTTRYTVKNVPKDNFLFGVCSVDQYGYKSPAVYPLPLHSN